MDYKDFYKSELFSDKDIEITDDYLVQCGWIRYDYLDPKWYYFEGPIGRIEVHVCHKKPYYDLHINHCKDNETSICTVSDIKLAIYSYVRGTKAIKYGFDGMGYRWFNVDTKEEENEYRYNKYCEMIKWMK